MGKQKTSEPPENWLKLLNKQSLFEVLTRKEKQVLLSDEVSTKHVIDASEVVVKQGDSGNSVFVICEGAVSVSLEDPQGGNMELYSLADGEVFGEMSLFGHSLRSATLVTAKPSKILEITGNSFLNLTKSHSEISLFLIARLSQRLRYTDNMILAQRMSGVDTSIEDLKSQVDVISQTTDAKLKAAQTMFEQTSARSNEIIESAGRARLKLTWFATFAGALMAGIAGFSLWNVKDARQEITKTVERAEAEAKKAQDAASVAEGAKTGALDSQSSVTTIEGQLGNSLREAKKIAVEMHSLRSKFEASNREIQFANDNNNRNRLFELLETRDLTGNVEKIYTKAISISHPDIRSEIINTLHEETISASSKPNSENFNNLYEIFLTGINDSNEVMSVDAKVATYYFLSLLNILANRLDRADIYILQISESTKVKSNIYNSIFGEGKFDLTAFLQSATIFESDQELILVKQEKVRNLHSLIKGGR